jgi:hypothetical protein
VQEADPLWSPALSAIPTVKWEAEVSGGAGVFVPGLL